MDCGKLCVLLVLVLNVHAWRTEYTSKGELEGEECYRHADEIWTCKQDLDCEAFKDMLKEVNVNFVPKTCSWQGRTPILCCPPDKQPQRVSVSISQEKCAEYAKLLCNDEDVYVMATQTQPHRKRREDPSQPDHIPDSSEPPPDSIYGGQLTKSGEYPNMPLNLLQRMKREDVSQKNHFTIINEELPVQAVAGGRLTRLREFPSVAGMKELPFHIEVAGGIFARPMDNPHMALIGYGDPGSIIWQCGGSLVSESFVLSAAHCVNTPYGLARWVRLGDLDLQSDSEAARPQQLEIVERVVHPGYHGPAFYNDLALFRLARPVVFDPFVRPACLHSDVRDPTGVGTVAGWGKNESNGPRSSALMQVNIKFVPSDECKRIVGVIDTYLPNGIDTDTMVCAGELGKDTCQGDSGGPLILPAAPRTSTNCLARLVGVTSFGPRNCGVTSVPGAYVRAAHFLSWIESVVWP